MNKVRTILNKPKARVYIYLAIIIGITLAVYYPSLSHILRGETYYYFLDTTGDNTVSSLVRNWWNYESVRQIAPGDTLMFRPLLFITLGLEKVYFGGNYLYWNITALLIHLIAVACLFRLLWKIKPGILASLMTILFATSFLCLNTILYEQIASYALFTAILLTGFYYMYQGTETGSKASLAISVTCMLVACFFHESGILFTALFIAYLYFGRKRIGSSWKYWSLAFAGILLAWLAIYIPSKFIYPVRFLNSELRATVTWQNLVPNLQGIWALTARWLKGALFPATFTTSVSPESFSYLNNITNKVSSDIAFALNCVAIYLIGKTYLFAQKQDKAQRIRDSFITLIASSAGILILANSIMRGGRYGLIYLVSFNFNVYIWLPLFFLLFYALICLQKLTKKYTISCAIALVILIVISAPQTFALNLEISKSHEQFRTYFSSIDDFIEEHQDEQDLSFDIIKTVYPMQEDLEFGYWRVPEDIDDNRLAPDNYIAFTSSKPEVIYEKYWDNENPKYTLKYDIEDNKLEIIK